MKIPSPAAQTLQQATSGNLTAIDEILVGIQPGIYNLAVRMLGNRDDAADAASGRRLRFPPGCFKSPRTICSPR
jgi:hypothetical protein